MLEKGFDWGIKGRPVNNPVILVDKDKGYIILIYSCLLYLEGNLIYKNYSVGWQVAIYWEIRYLPVVIDKLKIINHLFIKIIDKIIKSSVVESN